MNFKTKFDSLFNKRKPEKKIQRLKKINIELDTNLIKSEVLRNENKEELKQ